MNRLFLLIFVLFPVQSFADSENKPEIDVILNKYSTSMEAPVGILYWSLSVPPFNTGEGKCYQNDENPIECDQVKTRMLTELGGFLSQKGIYPEIFLITGIHSREIAEAFYISLKQTAYYDNYRVDGSGQFIPYQSEDNWQKYWWQESSGILIVSREQPEEINHPDCGYSCKITSFTDQSALFSKAVEMTLVTLKLRYNRKINLMLYENDRYSTDRYQRLHGCKGVNESPLADHLAITSLKGGIRQAYEVFDSQPPLVVAGSFYLPLDRPAIRQHLKKSLNISLEFSQNPVLHNFNLRENPLARFWVDFNGGIDFSKQRASSALVDMVGLHEPSGSANMSVKMTAVPFKSVKPFSMTIQRRVGNGQDLEEDYYLSKEFPEDCPDCPLVEYDYSHIYSPSGHEPVYAEVTFSDTAVSEFHLPGVTAPSDYIDGELVFNCDDEVVRNIIDFSRYRLRPDTLLLASIFIDNGQVFGQVHPLSRDSSYSATTRARHLYIGMLRKTAVGLDMAAPSNFLLNQCNMPLIPGTLCRMGAKTLSSLIEQANEQTIQNKKAFLRQHEGDYVKYNIYYQY